MTKKLLGHQSRHHIYLFDEDWEYLMRVFGPASRNKIPVSEAIRTIVHRAVGQIRAKADARIDEIEREAKLDGAEQ
jgi:hypothetical protein